MLYTFISFVKPELMDSCIRENINQAYDYFQGQHDENTFSHGYIECVDDGSFIDMTDDRY